MKTALNNLTDVPKFLAEVENTAVITSGYDRPHYIYEKTGRGGELGMNPWDKPADGDFATGTDVYGLGSSYENAAGDAALYGGSATWSKKATGTGTRWW